MEGMEGMERVVSRSTCGFERGKRAKRSAFPSPLPIAKSPDGASGSALSGPSTRAIQEQAKPGWGFGQASGGARAAADWLVDD